MLYFILAIVVTIANLELSFSKGLRRTTWNSKLNSLMKYTYAETFTERSFVDLLLEWFIDWLSRTNCFASKECVHDFMSRMIMEEVLEDYEAIFT